MHHHQIGSRRRRTQIRESLVKTLRLPTVSLLSGHGGVVIGSEMSGGVKRVTISNCVFDGTDAGIRLKASRGRGGVVEQIRVDNIVMRNIQRNAFIFDLFYDKTSKVEPVSERTPIFRNIHLSNITGREIKTNRLHQRYRRNAGTKHFVQQSQYGSRERIRCQYGQRYLF